MASGPQIGGGRIEIELDGRRCFLVPTLDACVELSQLAGPSGLVSIAERCNRLDFLMICAVIGAAIEIEGKKLNPGQREKLLPKAIYEAGVVGVAARCVEFITLVMNGGRSPEDEDEEEAAGDDGEAPLGSAT
jgi:hypothetical protein